MKKQLLTGLFTLFVIYTQAIDFNAKLTNYIGGPVISNVLVTNLLCNGDNTGSIEVIASGGTLTYSLDGITYQTSNIFNGLAAGTYTVYVDNGTGITTSGPHVVAEPSLLIHTVTIINAGCVNGGQIIVNAFGGLAGYMYTIDNGGTFQASNTFSGLPPGTYNVYAEDMNGCTSTMSVEIVGTFPPITVTDSLINETCSSTNGEIHFTATGGDGNYQYSINGGTTYQSSGSFTGLPAGSYPVDVIDQSGCTDTSTIVISNVGGVTVTTNGNQSICNGNSVSMTVTGATNYNWYNGPTLIGSGSSVSVSPITTTNYMVVGDDAICYDTAYVTITVVPIPVTTVSGNTTICMGESVVLTAGGGSSYFWAHSGETINAVTVTPSATTTTYTVTAYNGTCAGNQAQITITANPAATAMANSDVDTTYLVGMNGLVNFTNTGSNGASYNWNFGDGNTSTQTSPSHNFSTQGTYTVILTSTLGGCTDTDTIIITVLIDVGIIDNILSSNVEIYPNPTNEFITITFKLPYPVETEINIIDASGREVYQISRHTVSQNKIDINLAHFPDGVYFVKIQSNTDKCVRQLIKM